MTVIIAAKKWLWVAWMVISLLTLSWSQDRHQWKFGVEQDVLPYLTGGYYLGAWGGKHLFRGRILYVKAFKPEFLLPDGFSNNRIKSLAAVLDVFFRPDWQGWWMGGGLVHWSNRISHSSFSTNYAQWLLNGSMGYHLKLAKRVYLSPWAGLHWRFSGARHVTVGLQAYRPPVLNPEASLKVGWIF